MASVAAEPEGLLHSPQLGEEVPGGDPLAAVDALEAQTRTFTQRLYHGLLIARCLFPAAILVLALVSTSAGTWGRWTVLVWGVLAAWTLGTTPFLWSRLDWLRELPPLAWVEIGVFVTLVFVGVETRQWHLLHSFVPLVFCAWFATPRAARIVACGIVAALWASYVGGRLWEGLPIESRERPLVPSIVVLFGAFTLVLVRRVTLDIESVVAAQRRAADQVRSSRKVIATALARLESYALVAADVRGLVERLSATARLLRRPSDIEATRASDIEALMACVSEIELTVDEMSAPSGTDRIAAGSTVERELRDTLARSTVLGGEAALRVETGDRPLSGPLVAPFRRMVSEITANALLHGEGEVTVTLRASVDGGSLIEVTNTAHAAIKPRPGGRGLRSLQDDAALLGGTIEWREHSGQATVRLVLPALEGTSDPTAADLGAESLRHTVEQRQRSFETAVLSGRVLMAVVVLVSIQVLAEKHETLLETLTVASILVVGWNALLLARHLGGPTLIRDARMLTWVDCAFVITLILLLGGMGSPWLPVALGPAVMAGMTLGAGRAALIVALLALALAGGYGLVLAAGFDDLGTEEQVMPLGLVQNTVTLAVLAGIGVGVGWVFRQAHGAVDGYEDIARLELESAREAARADARLETARQLHNSLEQYVKAALLRLGALGRDGGSSVRGGTLADVQQRLTELRDALVSWDADLRAAGPAMPG